MTELVVTDHRPHLERTIVFLHGAGVTGWMWDAQVADLAEFRCIVIDLPGHGANHDVPWVSIDETAALVATVIAAAVGETRGAAREGGGARREAGRAERRSESDPRATRTVSLVGLSLGADVGLRLLAAFPQLCDYAVLTGMVTRPVHRAVGWLQSALAPLAERRSFHRLAGKAMGLSAERLDQFMATTSPMRRDDYRAIVNEIFAGVSLDGLEMVTVPTLALAGAKEPRAARDSVALIANVMSGATARIVADVGHLWNVEAPALFSATVRNWINAAE